MATFFDANRVRLSLKMRLSNYCWYNSSAVVTEQDGYSVTVNVSKLDNNIRKTIPPVVEGVSIKTILV